MKQFKDYLDSKTIIETIELFCEEDAAPTTTTGGVATKDFPMMTVKRETFMGHVCLSVDEDSYSSCMTGKIPFKRWSSYIKDDTLRTEVQNEFYKSKRLILKNEKTGSMAYIK